MAIPNYKSLEQLLHVIHSKFKCIIPIRSTRLHNTLEAQLDVEFIMQMVRNDALELGDLVEFIQFTFFLLETLQSPADDAKIATWKQKVLAQCQGDNLNSKLKFFLTFCQQLIQYLDKIKEDIIAFLGMCADDV